MPYDTYSPKVHTPPPFPPLPPLHRPPPHPFLSPSHLGVEVDALSHSGSSALFEAALAGKAQACQVLIDEGHADVNLADVRLFTPLFAAAGFDHCDVVSLLLDRGAHVAQAMFSGATALHYVCQEGFVNCAKVREGRRGKEKGGTKGSGA